MIDGYLTAVKDVLSDPRLAAPLALLLLMLPILRVLHKRTESFIDRSFTAENFATTWPRIEAFVLVLHCLVGMAAASWLYFATSYPPPMMAPEHTADKMYAYNRFTLYFASFGASYFPIALIATSAGSLSDPIHPFPINLIYRGFASVGRAFVVGFFLSVIVVAYSAFFNPKLFTGFEVPKDPTDAFFCWYTVVSIYTISLGLIAYLPVLALRQLWRLTAKMVP